MTSTEREALIRAVQGVTWNASNYPAKAQPHILGQDVVPLTIKIVDAVEAVFEQAHAPTDDERMAAHKEAKRRYGRGELQVHRRVGFEAGAAWAVARRPVQAEPTVVRRNEWADGSHQEVYSDGSLGPWVAAQAEPTPIQVRAAAKAINVEGWTAEGDPASPLEGQEKP